MLCGSGGLMGAHNIPRRRFFQGTGLSLLLGAAGVAAGPVAAAVAPGRGKTFVLVHGAWLGGWCWDAVARALRAHGHQVSTPTCPGVGEQKHLLSREITLSTHIASIVNHLRYEDLHEVVLVGSGYAGAVISGVADQVPDLLSSLVYVDAMVLDNGQSMFDAQPAAVTQSRLAQVAAEGGGLAIPAPPLASFQLEEGARRAWVGQRLTPQPVATYQEKLVLRHPLGNGLPRIYVDCQASPFAPLAELKRNLRRQPGWTWRALAAHHDPMFGSPQLLADMLEEL